MRDYIFRLTNLQSIEFAEIKIPETGLVRFEGPNSNGKSVLVKVLWDVLSGGLKKKEKRNPLINYDHNSGTLTIIKPDTTVLHINIDREASRTFLELVPVGGEQIRRYLSDKNSHELISMFGFHYDTTRDVSLNIYNTYDPLLFVTTRAIVNYDVLQSATTDPKAEMALTEIKRKTDEIDEIKKNLTNTRAVLNGQLQSLVIHDIAKERTIQEQATFLADAIDAIKPPVIFNIDPIPDLSVIELLQHDRLKSALIALPRVPDMSTIEILNTGTIQYVINKVEDNSDLLNIDRKLGLLRNNVIDTLDLADTALEQHSSMVESLKDSECPTCGRGYDCEH